MLNRAHSRVGISAADVVAVLGHEPDVLVPSDREIPRAVNEGVPIVTARPQSEPAQAYRQLAGILTRQAGRVPPHRSQRGRTAPQEALREKA